MYASISIADMQIK